MNEYDDDQNFVADIVKEILSHDTVDYNKANRVIYTDEGRNADLRVHLYTGDKYLITIEELH